MSSTVPSEITLRLSSLWYIIDLFFHTSVRVKIENLKILLQCLNQGSRRKWNFFEEKHSKKEFYLGKTIHLEILCQNFSSLPRFEPTTCSGSIGYFSINLISISKFPFIFAYFSASSEQIITKIIFAFHGATLQLQFLERQEMTG